MVTIHHSPDISVAQQTPATDALHGPLPILFMKHTQKDYEKTKDPKSRILGLLFSAKMRLRQKLTLAVGFGDIALENNLGSYGKT